MVPPLKARSRVTGLQFAPEVYQAELAAWVNAGIMPDDELLQSILCNDLSAAVGTSSTNAHWGLIRATVIWLWNFAPDKCWGSLAATYAWRRPKVR
jgi:hypothetical protein